MLTEILKIHPFLEKLCNVLIFLSLRPHLKVHVTLEMC